MKVCNNGRKISRVWRPWNSRIERKFWNPKQEEKYEDLAYSADSLSREHYLLRYDAQQPDEKLPKFFA